VGRHRWVVFETILIKDIPLARSQHLAAINDSFGVNVESLDRWPDSAGLLCSTNMPCAENYSLWPQAHSGSHDIPETEN
jgi:hypothetical protein